MCASCICIDGPPWLIQHPNAPLNNNREALAAKLDYHLSNGVTIYMAFHTGAEAPSPFVPSDGQRSSEGHLIGTSLSASFSYQPQALYTIYISNTPIPYPHTRTPQPPPPPHRHICLHRHRSHDRPSPPKHGGLPLPEPGLPPPVSLGCQGTYQYLHLSSLRVVGLCTELGLYVHLLCIYITYLNKPRAVVRLHPNQTNTIT